jgi:S1-C subfamily serine protease
MPVRLGADQEKALGQPSALLVTSVQPDTAAGRGGVLLGDALLAFDGHPLHRPGDLFARLDEEAIGRTVTLRVLRAGEVKEVPVTIGARDARSS